MASAVNGVCVICTAVTRVLKCEMCSRSLCLSCSAETSSGLCLDCELDRLRQGTSCIGAVATGNAASFAAASQMTELGDYHSGDAALTQGTFGEHGPLPGNSCIGALATGNAAGFPAVSLAAKLSDEQVEAAVQALGQVEESREDAEAGGESVQSSDSEHSSVDTAWDRDRVADHSFDELQTAGVSAPSHSDMLREPCSFDHGRAMEQALPRPAFMHAPLPWEIGFAGLALSGMSRPSSSLIPYMEFVPLPPTVPEAKPELPEESKRRRVTVPFSLDSMAEDWTLVADRSRTKALTMWAAIALLHPECSRLGRQMQGLDECLYMRVLADTVEAKATSTLNSRGYSVLQYIKWHHGSIGGQVFPLVEAHVYAYCCFLQDSRAPATRATRLVEAIAFSKYVIGLEMEPDLLESSRLHGSALTSYRRKRMLLQRDALSVAMVTHLEKLAAGSQDPYVVVFAGFLCFLTHTRARFSDAQAVSAEPTIIGGYLESQTDKHKTSNLPQKRQKWLPLVAPALGVSGVAWAENWMAVRRQQRLRASKQCPLMPRMNSNGSWTKARLSIEDATVWMRELLRDAVADEREVSNVGTHSCKATPLSWASKIGISKSYRRILGNHIPKADSSLMAYARDSISAPLRELEKCYAQIRAGEFVPDANRSGMIVNKVVDEAPEQSEATESDESASSAEEPAEETDAEEELDKHVQVLEAVYRGSPELDGVLTRSRAAARNGSDELYRHSGSLVVHRARDGSSGSVMACGKSSAHYARIGHSDLVVALRCKSCFGRKMPDDEA